MKTCTVSVPDTVPFLKKKQKTKRWRPKQRCRALCTVPTLCGLYGVAALWESDSFKKEMLS